ncbi:hypothetical protein SLS60_007437 [Paraconiothyrium brasiliense]|uniref:Amino acid transporter n=1 Tax=Paraconiothyrium brasiliense TaxID=300254 RepID=A0ABR3R5C4_9PLEO
MNQVTRSISISETSSSRQQIQLSPAASAASLVPGSNHAPEEHNDGDARSPPLEPEPLIQVPWHRELTWQDVSALIVNKMIGTGIFTGPPAVLMCTGRKDTALAIWAAGFMYTLLSMILYLEFSRKLPYTGGELIYLDELLPKPALLAYTCYALYFICIYSTATNGMQFARQTIIAATESTDVTDQRVMRFIAVSSLIKPLQVAGEIPNYATLRKGFIGAVLVVGLLYMFINIVYCYAMPWPDDGRLELQYVPLFFGNSSSAEQAWAILTAFSAVGIKQTVAWTNLLPWSPLWMKSAPIPRKEAKDYVELRMLNNQDAQDQHSIHTGEPQGGLLLHWIVCVIQICATAAIPVVTEAIMFPGQLLNYFHAIVGVVLGAMFSRFHNIENKVPVKRRWQSPREARWLRPKILRALLGWTYAALSLAILVLACIPPYKNTDGAERVVKGWFYPIICFGLLVVFSIYYFLDGYENYYEVFFPGAPTYGNFLYWFFGGTDERYYPRVSDQLHQVGERFAVGRGGNEGNVPGAL